MIPPGIYTARARRGSLYENAKGSLIAALEIDVDGPEGVVAKMHFLTLATADNGIMLKNIDRGRRCFPNWAGDDPAWFDGENVADAELSVQIKHEPNAAGTVYDNIAWINPPGGGPGAALPASGDLRGITTKWGAMFRAAAGGVPLQRKPQPPAAPPKAPAPPPRPPIAQNQTAETCWAAFQAKHPGKDEAALAAPWFQALEAANPGVDAAAYTAAHWANLAASIEEQLPY